MDNKTLHFHDASISVVNVSDLVVRRVECFPADIAFIEISDKDAIKGCCNTILLDTGYKEWVLLKKPREYCLEVQGVVINAWVGYIMSPEKVSTYMVTTSDFLETARARGPMPTVRSIFARCHDSMLILDRMYRTLMETIDLVKFPLVAIKAVAGSGKTTALMMLAKNNPNKRFLYVAFSKSLVRSMKERRVPNIHARTFDALVYDIAGTKAKIVDLKPQNLQFYVPWFEKKNRKLKRHYIKLFQSFCKDEKAVDITRWMPSKPLLKAMWDAFSQNTFDGLRKRAQLRHSFKTIVDRQYDVIVVDEAQDFDAIMYDILMTDTTLPKVFVGDPMQSIFKWRGSINVFDRLPEEAFLVEFYSSFRVGDTACKYVRGQFEQCWMMSKAPTDTLVHHVHRRFDIPVADYVYLFRTWKGLLTKAADMKGIWINDFDPLNRRVTRLVEQIDLDIEDQEEEDDLPGFIRAMKKDGVESLMEKIRSNVTDDGKIRFYTIFGFKGLEHDVIRIHNDYEAAKEPELHYVALTRGMRHVYIDL